MFTAIRAAGRFKCLCMYVCMCVCMYVCMYVCIYIYICVCVYIYIYISGPGVAQWLRHCATSWAVQGSNPGGVGHRDFSRGYRQNHVPWGQLSF